MKPSAKADKCFKNDNQIEMKNFCDCTLLHCCHQIHAFFSKYGHFSPIHVAKSPKFYAYPRDYVIF